MAGPVLNSEHLLESVVRITAQRDRETLEVCLVGTLRDLLDASRVSIVRVVPVSDTLVAEIVATRGRDAFEDGKDSFVQVLPAEVEQVALLRAARRIEGIVETTLPDDAGRHVTAWPYATAQGSSEGFLVVEDARPLEADRRLIQGIGTIYQNYLSIIDDAEHDTLTGLRNRKTFDDRLMRITASAPLAVQEPEEGALWLGIVDIDHFKRINDTFGHVFGDEVLLLIAQMMKSLFPRRDLVFRYGGEEFVAVVPASTQAAASALFDGFRRAVEEHDFPQVGRVTASVGFVRIVGGRALAELVGQADHALYYAKHNGRNQVRSFDQLVAEGFLDSAVAEGDIELF